METTLITQLSKTFEEAAYEQDGVEYWLARELQDLPGYSEWRNLLKTIKKPRKVAKHVRDHLRSFY